MLQVSAGSIQGRATTTVCSGAITAVAASPTDPRRFAAASRHAELVVLHAAAQGLQAEPLRISNHLHPSKGATPAFTCCTFDTSGTWLIAGLRSGAILHYSLAARSVLHRTDVQQVPQVRFRHMPHELHACEAGCDLQQQPCTLCVRT